MNYMNLFKKPKLLPLPTFPSIEIKDIPASSILLWYGGVKITELVGNRLYGHPYYPAAFHAAFYMDNGLYLNVGAFKTIEKLELDFRSTRRIDVIIDTFLTPEERKLLCVTAEEDLSKPKIGIDLPDYSWREFLRFGFPFLKPSSKEYCSENVCNIFATAGRKISDEECNATAPWHLLEHALKSPGMEIKTVWIGKDFKGEV